VGPGGGAPRSPSREDGVLSSPNSSSDPSLLLERVAGKDPRALADLYDRLAPVALALAGRILGDLPEAEAVLQGAFLRLWQEAGGYDGSQGSPTTWVLSWVRSDSIDRLRRREALQSVSSPSVDRSPATPDAHGEHAASGEERERLARVVASLPADQRKALDLAYFEGLSLTQIAQRQGEPLDTVKTRLSRGMERLRQTLPGAVS
jgi:RNA polymerase sigma-70 factor (ECF subfamily)